MSEWTANRATQRTIGLAGACLLGGLLVATVMGGLGTHEQTARADARSTSAPLSEASPGDVVINEVAWMGTAASSWDEWIELYNTTAATTSLAGWTISFADGSPATITLSGDIGPHGYYLLERDNRAVSDVDADQAYGGGQMNNAGERVRLHDGAGTLVDTANGAGGGWPAGTASAGDLTYATMERVDPGAPDADANWRTNDGVTRNGLDAGGDPINGTPRACNACARPPVEDVADLVVAKTGPASAAPGTSITYRIVISNVGRATATATWLTDTLPLDVAFVSQASPFPFTAVGQHVVWQIGDAPTGTRHTITLTARVTGTASGPLTNLVSATTTASETVTSNNVAHWTMSALPPVRIYALAPTNYWGSGEAAALVNVGPQTVTLANWCLDDALSSASRACFPPGARVAPGQIVWLAQDGDGFYPVWGFDAGWAAQAITRPVATLDGSWPVGLLADDGDSAYLLDADGSVVDAVAYGTGSVSHGWTGPAVPYPCAGFGSGQVLYRKLDQRTGLPVPDTDTAADWAQDPADPINGRRLRYPGWDLEPLFLPAEIRATSTVSVAVAPEGALDLVSQTIASARHTLRIEAYTLKSPALYPVIQDRIQAGVLVTALLESRPASGMEDVEKWVITRTHRPPTSTVFLIGESAARYRFQHAKFILVDDRLALVSTDNFGENSMPADPKENGTMGHRGFVAVTDDPAVVARLADVFRRDCDPLHHLDVAPYDIDYAPPEDFTPLPPPDWTTYTTAFTAPLVTTATHVSVIHAPEHSLRDRDSLLGLLGRAGSGDHVAAMQMNEPLTWAADAGPVGRNPRIEALLAAARRGAEVRVLLDGYHPSSNTETCLALNESAAQEGLNLTCHLANTTGLGIHAKVFLVSLGGERWVHLGSINGTETSSKGNREVALQIRSAEAYDWMHAIFDHDYATGHAPMCYRAHLPLAMRDHVPPASYPLVTEVFVNPGGDDAGKEWIELYNPGAESDISGWTVGDAQSPGDYGDGRYAFPAGARLLHGQVAVLAACATDFAAAHGYSPAYEWIDCDAAVPDLAPAGSWAGFGLALGNGSDEVVLTDAGGAPVDSVAWGGEPRAGVAPYPLSPGECLPSEASLKRYPPGADRDDCACDFYVSYSPSPGIVASD